MDERLEVLKTILDKEWASEKERMGEINKQISNLENKKKEIWDDVWERSFRQAVAELKIKA